MGARLDQQAEVMGRKRPKHCSRFSPFSNFLFPIQIIENVFKLLKYIENKIKLIKIQNKFPKNPFY
jgi:hypothetical protein